MTGCRIGLWLTLLLLLLHNQATFTQARPQANSTQQNVAVDVTADDEQVPEARANVSVATADEAGGEAGGSDDEAEDSEGGTEGSAVVEEDSDEKDETEEGNNGKADADEVEEAGNSNTRKRNGVVKAMKTLKQLIQFYWGLRSAQRIIVTYDYNNCQLKVTYDKSNNNVKVEIPQDPVNLARCTNAALINVARFIDYILQDDPSKRNDEGRTSFTDMLRGFVMESIDIDTSARVAEFKAKLTQPLSIVKDRLKIGQDSKMTLKFRYGMNLKKFKYQDIGLALEGHLEITDGYGRKKETNGAKISYNMNKEFDTRRGNAHFELKGASSGEITFEELARAFGTQPENDDRDWNKDDKSELYKVKLSEANVYGKFDLDHDFQLRMTAKLSEIAGIENVDVSAVFAAVRGTGRADFGAHAKFTGIKPMVFIQKAVGPALDPANGNSDANNRKKELTDIPILGDIEFDMEMQIASSYIGVVKVGKSVDSQNPNDFTQLVPGTRLTFTLPVRRILEKYEVQPKGSKLDPYVEVEITRSGLEFRFPKDPVLNMHDILVACAPKIRNWAWQRALSKIPSIKVETFKFNMWQRQFSVHLKTAEPISFGANNMFTISDAEVNVIKSGTYVDFEVKSTVQFARGTFTVGVSKKDTLWKIEGKIERVSSVEVMRKFVGDNYESDYEFVVVDGTILAQIGTPMQLRIYGRVTFNGWTGDFETCVSNANGNKDWAVALLIENQGFKDIVKGVKKTGDEVESTALNWMTKVSFAFMIVSDKEARFNKQVFRDLLYNQKNEGNLPGSGISIIFEASVEVPQEAQCGQDNVCLFLRKKAMLDKIVLRGSIQVSPFNLNLKVGVEGEIVLKDTGTKVILKSAYIILKIATNLDFGIEASIDMKFKNAVSKEVETVSMKAALTFSPISVITIAIEVSNWNNPFGLQAFSISRFAMRVGIQFPTFIPTEFSLQGTFKLGVSSQPKITASIGGGYNIGTSVDYYFYAKISDFSINTVIRAFNWRAGSLPQWFKDVEFNGVKAGLSLPTGRTISIDDTETLEMSPGFFLAASVTVLGYTVSVEIEVKIPDRFYLKGTFSPLHLAGGKICLTSATGGETKGPQIEIEVEPKKKKFQFQLDAAIKIFMFEAETVINISDEGIDFWIKGRFVNILEAEVHMTMPFTGRGRGSKDLASKESGDEESAGRNWKFSVCLRSHDRQTEQITAQTDETMKDAEKIYKDANDAKKRNEKIKNHVIPKYYNCYWVAGKGEGLDAQVQHSPKPSTPVACFESCAKAKKTDPDINGVSMLQDSYHTPTECRCEKYMTGIIPHDTYKTCFLEPAAFKSDEGTKVGRSQWGMWNNYIQCPPRKRIKGFRLQVDWSVSKDITALNGIEFKCEALYPGEQEEFPRGYPYTLSGVIWWRFGEFPEDRGDWTECDGENNYVKHISLRSMSPDDKYSAWDDDWSGLNFRIKCDHNDIHEGKGRQYYDVKGYESSLQSGMWSDWSQLDCPAGKYLCGMRAALESPSTLDDETALNKVQSACCEKDESIQRPVYECKYAQGRIQKFDGVDRASGDKWRYGHHQIEMENPRENCAKECMKIKLRDDAVNSVMVREPGNTDTFDADLKFNCLCKRDGGLLKATNVGWKSCFLVPATSWTTASKRTVDTWKGKLDGTEKLLVDEIAKMERGKRTMNQKCVRECARARVPAGGFRREKQKLGGVDVWVPVWDPNANVRDNPWCLADCETSGLAIWNHIVGGFQLLKFKFYEYKLYISHTVQGFLDKMVNYAKDIYDVIKNADSFGEGILAAGSKILGDAANWVMENLLYIEELCASAGMDEYSDSGFCFSANATIYLGGKKPGKEPTKFDNKRICLSDLTSWAFWKDLAKQALALIFPDLKEIYDSGKELKKELADLNRNEKKLANTRSTADKDSKKFDTYTEKDAEKEPRIEYRPPKMRKGGTYREKFNKLMSEVEDDYTVRNDETVQAFREIYDDDDDDDDDDDEPANASAKTGESAANGIQFDPASLTNASEGNICRRTGDLVNVYSGAAESYNFLLNSGEKAKKGFEDYLGGQSNKFIGLEAEIRNRSITLKLDEDEEEDSMFFINKAKQGITKRKDSLTQRYQVIDKTSLETWRKYVGEVTSQKQMDIASFLEALSTASKETAKRMEVPNAKLEKSLSSAHKIMKNLLGNDGATLSSKKSSVEKLLSHANVIREVAKSNKCFENGLTE